MKNKIKSVAVYCGHQSGGNPEYVRDAQRVGELLAYHKFTLVFGGGDVGLMGAVATAALNNGGKVIGVSTKCVISMQEPIHAGVETKITKGLSARKQKMYDISDAFVILPGGIGTLDEMTDIMTKQQVGETCKPIFVLNTGKYWEIFGHLMTYMQQELFMPDLETYNLHIVNTPDDLIRNLLNSDKFFLKCNY